MNGKVAFVGWSNVFGNYIIVNQPNEYQTLYGHLSVNPMDDAEIMELLLDRMRKTKNNEAFLRSMNTAESF